MIDMKLILSDPDHYEELIRSRDPSISLLPLIKLYKEIKELKNSYDRLRHSQKEFSKKMTGGASQESLAEIKKLKGQVVAVKQELHEKEEIYSDMLARIPNIPDADTVDSLDPEDKQSIRMKGEKPQFDFPHKNHLELNESLHIFDFKRATKIVGSGWPLYTDIGARLEWALINYMLDKNREKGFIQLMPPLLANENSLFCSGQFPKFIGDSFGLRDDKYYLIPTSEVSINAMHKDEILEKLPLKYTAYTPCFRREAGAAGKKEQGLIRMHQFNKVELFGFATPDGGDQLFEDILASAEEIVSSLGFHYRIMKLSRGDMSFPASTTCDIELFLPSQKRYYEVSSVSQCKDFCARRSMIRCRDKEGKLHYVYTVNGSSLATSRIMVAILENFQNSDGSVQIPEVLHPYLGEKKLNPVAKE